MSCVKLLTSTLSFSSQSSLTSLGYTVSWSKSLLHRLRSRSWSNKIIFSQSRLLAPNPHYKHKLKILWTPSKALAIIGWSARIEQIRINCRLRSVNQKLGWRRSITLALATQLKVKTIPHLLFKQKTTGETHLALMLHRMRSTLRSTLACTQMANWTRNKSHKVKSKWSAFRSK